MVDLSEQILKVIVWFQVVCFCCFRNAVDDRTGFRAGNCIDHDPGGVGKIYCNMQFAEGIIHENKRFDIEKLAG